MLTDFQVRKGFSDLETDSMNNVGYAIARKKKAIVHNEIGHVGPTTSRLDELVRKMDAGEQLTDDEMAEYLELKNRNGNIERGMVIPPPDGIGGY